MWARSNREVGRGEPGEGRGGGDGGPEASGARGAALARESTPPRSPSPFPSLPFPATLLCHGRHSTPPPSQTLRASRPSLRCRCHATHQFHTRVHALPRFPPGVSAPHRELSLASTPHTEVVVFCYCSAEGEELPFCASGFRI